MLREADRVVAFEVSDTGIGIPGRKAEADLRGLPAGRCQHQPQVRRHRARTGDQPRARQPPWRRDPPPELARQRQHVHALPAAALQRSLDFAPSRRPALRRARCRCLLAANEQRPAEQLPDDRADIVPGDTTLLIVEDDAHYARVLIDLAHDKGFKVIVVGARRRSARSSRTSTGRRPISLDVFLPDMLGWTVLSQLKQDPATRHIPVQIVTLDDDRQHGLARGAFSFLTKPTTDRWASTRRSSRIKALPSRAASACSSSRTTRPSRSACRSFSATTTSI